MEAEYFFKSPHSLFDSLCVGLSFLCLMSRTVLSNKRGG